MPTGGRARRSFRSRPATDADTAAIVRLLRRRLDEFNIGPAHIDDSLAFYWSQPGLVRERHHVVVTARHRVVATAMSWPDPVESRMTMLGYVTPRARHRGIGSWLIDWFTRTARDEGAALAVVDTAASDGAARALLLRSGYAEVRAFFTMRHDEPAGVPEPVWPDGITLESGGVAGIPLATRLGDAYELCFAGSFDYRPDSYRSFIATWIGRDSFDPDLVTIARAPDGSIAGYVVALTTGDGRSVAGDVDELGVAPGWRRLGLGTALLQHGLRSLAARGAGTVSLGVDAENATGALPLYERTGFRAVSSSATFHRRLDED